MGVDDGVGLVIEQKRYVFTPRRKSRRADLEHNNLQKKHFKVKLCKHAGDCHLHTGL